MIESYRFGSITINGKTYRQDCIVSSNFIKDNWWRESGHRLTINDIKNVIEEYKPEAVVVGTGKYGLMKILPETKEYLEGLNIKMYVAKTDEAVKVYNKLLSNVKTIGFFHLTC